jgi:cobalt-zinc-cadmium efflux system protein
MHQEHIDHVTVELEMPGQECSQEHCTPLFSSDSGALPPAPTH